MELRLLTATFRFKDIHVAFAKGTKVSTNREVGMDREINLSRSHFLEQSQNEMMQEVATR